MPWRCCGIRRPDTESSRRVAPAFVLARQERPALSISGRNAVVVDERFPEEALSEIATERQEDEDDELRDQLARVPDLNKSLRKASPEVKRQVFESFDLQIAYDRVEHRVELTATVPEAVADALENAKPSRRRAQAW
jgi:hypothetical protein